MEEFAVETTHIPHLLPSCTGILPKITKEDRTLKTQGFPTGALVSPVVRGSLGGGGDLYS